MMGIETMKNVSPKTVDRSTLVQRSSIRLDPAAPREDRLREFIKQIRNPYCYLDGKTDQHPLLEGHLPQGFYCAQGTDGKRRVQEAQSPVWLSLG